MHIAGGMAIEWVGRLFDASIYPTLTYDDCGNLLNKEVWHDPRIDEGSNFNVILDVGASSLLNTMFGLAASTVWVAMAAGSGTTAAVHTQTALVSELVSGGTRSILTNTSGTLMTSPSVVSVTTYNDTTYSPTYSYYTQASVMATWNGATDARNGQQFQEFGLASQVACPGGLLFDRYVFPSPITLNGNPSPVILQVTAVLRLT